MFLSRWLKSAPRTSRPQGPANRFRPSLESLDARDLPSAAYFVANDGVHGEELWKTDGTPAGTAMVKDINPGVYGSAIRDITNLNGTIYFLATDGVNGGELWKSDGTAAGTTMVKDINPGAGFAFDNYANGEDALVVLKGTLYFRATNGTNGSELWKSDGTAAGTVMVKDIYAGSNSGGPTELTVMNGQLYFEALTNNNGFELWKSDGTAAGTVMVKDVIKGGGSGHAHGLTAVGNTLYFAATDGDQRHSYELWKSDGTAAGTVMVKDINPNGGAGVPSTFAQRLAIGNTLYFVGDDGVHGRELWKSDGTAAGTVMVKDISPGTASSLPHSMVNLNGRLFFIANSGTSTDGSTTDLWTSDGTTAGTSLFHDTFPSELKVFGGRLYYTDGAGGLWSTDGTQAGTAPTEFRPLVAINGQVLYTHTDAEHGEELWFGDGTVSGTSLVMDIWPGVDSSFVNSFVVVG